MERRRREGAQQQIASYSWVDRRLLQWSNAPPPQGHEKRTEGDSDRRTPSPLSGPLSGREEVEARTSNPSSSSPD